MLEKTRGLLGRREPVRIVCYGDSISEVDSGLGRFGGASCAEKNWGQQLAEMLRRGFPGSAFAVENFAIGSQNTYEAYGRLRWLEPYHPDLVLIELGPNDCAGHDLPPSATATALTLLVEGARSTGGADVAVAGMAGDNPLMAYLNHFEETQTVLKSVAEKMGVPFIDVRSCILAATEGGKRWGDFHNGPGDAHPNDEGHRVWASTVFDALKEHLGA